MLYGDRASQQVVSGVRYAYPTEPPLLDDTRRDGAGGGARVAGKVSGRGGGERLIKDQEERRRRAKGKGLVWP